MPSPLEMPPPPPAQVGTPGPPPQASLQSLAGGPANGSPQGDQSLQIVTQHLMTAEDEIRAAIRIKPELSAVLESFLNNVKPQIGQILFGGGGPNSSQGPGGVMPPVPGVGNMLASAAAPALSSRP